jgi:threonine/homoserine/homoserine lactone efflux protein
MDTLQALIFPAFGLLACGIVFLISAVSAQELGRLFLRRQLGRWASGLVGVVGALLALSLAVLCLEAWFPVR